MADGSSHVVGFFHAGVTVSDIEAALRFYRDGLGLEVLTDVFTSGEHTERIWALAPERVRVVFLRVPGSEARLELFAFEGIERHSASARPCEGQPYEVVFCEDPWGTIVEIMSHPHEHLFANQG